jgi:hypothetical protein
MRRVVAGLLLLRKAATEAGSAPFSMAQVATECRNRPGVKHGMPAALQAPLMARAYFFEAERAPLHQTLPGLQDLGKHGGAQGLATLGLGA